MRGRGPEETLPADLNCWSFYLCQLRCRHRNGVCLIDTVGLWFLSAARHHSDVLFTLKLLSVQKWSVRVLQGRCSLNTSEFLSSSAILSHNGLHLYSNHCVLKEAHCLPASHHMTYMQRDLAVLFFLLCVRYCRAAYDHEIEGPRFWPWISA